MTIGGMLDARLASARREFVRPSCDFWARADPAQVRLRHTLGDLVHPLLFAAGFGRSFVTDAEVDARRAEVESGMDALEEAAALFADDPSRRLLVDLLAYRILGPRHVRLPSNTPAYWEARRRVPRRRVRAGTFRRGRHGLDLYRIPGAAGGPEYRMHNAPYGVLLSVELEHYAFERNGVRIAVEPGDLVVDGGGCWGESALRFATAAGPDGHVLSFEFSPGNLEVFEANLDLNPALGGRISIRRAPLWSRAASMRIGGSGPSTHVAEGAGGPEAPLRSVTIDDEVDAVGRPLGFVKLDVEGAEPDVLEGARRTLERDRPRLAISLYHRLSDLSDIPLWISKLDVGYEMYLAHPTIDEFETVLFCRPTA